MQELGEKPTSSIRNRIQNRDGKRICAWWCVVSVPCFCGRAYVHLRILSQEGYQYMPTSPYYYNAATLITVSHCITINSPPSGLRYDSIYIFTTMQILQNFPVCTLAVMGKSPLRCLESIDCFASSSTRRLESHSRLPMFSSAPLTRNAVVWQHSQIAWSTRVPDQVPDRTYTHARLRGPQRNRTTLQPWQRARRGNLVRSVQSERSSGNGNSNGFGTTRNGFMSRLARQFCVHVSSSHR